MLPLLPPAKALYIFLLAAQQHNDASTTTTTSTRRCFLDRSTTCAKFLLLNTLHHPLSAFADEDNVHSVTAITTSSSDPLYLARPVGISSNDDDGRNRPSAPIEFLLPATRVGLYIYQLLSIAEELAQLKKKDSRASSSSNPSAAESSLIARLDNLLVSSPPSFITSTDPTVTRGDPYNNLPPLLGEIVVQQQKQKERKEQLSITNVGLAPQLFEVGELMGERRQWSRLVQAEKARENASEIRRALNIYTTNLNFNRNKYVYSGSSEEKKKLIREDRLPSATEVIRSDLDARDLYRNEVQTKLEDAKSEYLYQKRVGFEDDVSELVRLLKDAKIALDSWFEFIPDEDIKQALEAVQREQNR